MQHAGMSHVADQDVYSAQQRTSPMGPTQPLLRQLCAMRGYNPVDVRRYSQFVAYLADRSDPPDPEVGISQLPIVNKSLLDMAGARYLLAPSEERRQAPAAVSISKDPRWRAVNHDERATAYVFSGWGVSRVRSYTVFENLESLPRAFVVPSAAPLGDESDALTALKANNFRRRVLLEGDEAFETDAVGDSSLREATIRVYEPNRIVIDVDTDFDGWLVLSDVWFADWNATVDGQPTQVRRANYVFRAVAVSQGRHEVVFRYQPRSYALGRRVSGWSGAAVAAILLVAWGWERRRFKRRRGRD